MTISTTINTPTEKQSEFHYSDLFIAEQATAMGFPVAGTFEEIYEDAVILISPIFSNDWAPCKVRLGRVMKVTPPPTTRGDYDNEGFHRPGDHYVVHFILMTEDGLQIQVAGGKDNPVYFALPEDSEDFARFEG